MKIEFIYTFENLEQKFVSYPFVLTILESKKTLSEYALADLSDKQKQELIRVSACVYSGRLEKIIFPKWFLKCNGKLFFKKGKLLEPKSK